MKSCLLYSVQPHSKESINSLFVLHFCEGNVSAGWRVRFEEEGIYEVAIWSPQSSSFTQRALVTINHQHGSDSVVLSQQHL